MSKLQIVFQMVIETHGGDKYLLEMDYDEMPCVGVGMLLIDIPNMPNVFGPAAETDNQIVRVAFSGARKKILAQVHGVRYNAYTLEETMQDLPGWQHIRKIQQPTTDSDLFGHSDKD